MQAKTMEGLIGAGVNMKMMDVPMRVYKEARRKDDYGTMERAMGYVSDYAKKTEEYKTIADDGMKEDAETARQKAEEERLKTIEKRREECEQIQERIEAAQESVESGKEENNVQNSEADTKTNNMIRNDTIEISEEGRKLLAKSLETLETDAKS